jgi:probable F420-dependent oxidoreductase
MTAVKISTGLPNCREGRQNAIGAVTVETIRRVAQVAEECGYYALWPNEFIVAEPRVAARYQAPPTLFDPIVTMSYVAALTERIRITPSTIVLPYHEPLLLSREIATLDVFSGGRITLGIGLGGAAAEFRRLRQTLENPNRGQMMDEYVQALRVLWSDSSATFQGSYVGFAEAESLPKPIQNPLPIFMAGHAEGVFRRLAAYGQGWIDSSMHPEDLEAHMERLRGYAVEAGRGDVDFELARQFYVSIADTEEEAKANHAESVPPATRPQPAEAGSPVTANAAPQERFLIGTPDQILRRLRDYVAAGVTELCVIFYFPNDDAAERQLRHFATEVAPHLEVAG